MEKTIKLGKKTVRLNNDLNWTLEYRNQFGKDIIPAIMPAIASMLEGLATIVSGSDGEDITVKSIAENIEGRSMDILLPMFQLEFVDLINITWALAKAANEDIEPPAEWVKQFEGCFPLDVVCPAIYELVIKGFVSSKNLKWLRTKIASLQPLSTTSSSQDLKED